MEAEERAAANEEGRGGNLVVRWGLMAVLLLVLYVLSSGPAAKLFKMGLLPGYVMVAYRPLEMAVERIPLLNDFVAWYLIDVWKAVP